jgi:hypothetical protein
VTIASSVRVRVLGTLVINFEALPSALHYHVRNKPNLFRVAFGCGLVALNNCIVKEA